jgi:hypothetical protein
VGLLDVHPAHVLRQNDDHAAAPSASCAWAAHDSEACERRHVADLTEEDRLLPRTRHLAARKAVDDALVPRLRHLAARRGS